MTVEKDFRFMASGPMTTAERLEGLISAVALHTRLATVRAELAVQFAGADTAPHIRKLIADKLDDTDEAECLAQEEAVAWASVLLSDGTLGDCRSFLANRDQFRQFVARNQLERTRPKDLSGLAAVLARIFHRSKAAPSPSPTR